MADLGLSAYAAMAVFCFAAAFLVLWLFSLAGGFRSAGQRDPHREIGFDVDAQGDIADATHLGESVLARIGRSSRRQWPLLFRALQTRFPALPRKLDDARALSPARLPALSPDDPGILVLDESGDRLKLRLEDPATPTLADRHLHFHLLDQLSSLNNVVDMFPYPVWLRQANGQPYWNNRAYARLLEATRSNPEAGEIDEFDLAFSADQDSRTARRMVQDRDSGQSHWFNVTNTDTGNGTILGFAIDIDPVIEAEQAQRNFVQTLTKTFAQLSTGLAIFDRERQLALFNPALIDLLALPAEFLSARPTLLTFFDKLRDNRMMPEPKNYANWRHQITDLVIASVDGRYQETWTLPSGLTYRVTGRPHPDGAVALLFEDISAEISLTRRFRSQLNLGQAVIDTLDEAVAVFTSTGSLTLSNQAFHKMWKMDPDTSFAEVTLRDALAQWQSLAEPGPFWTRLQGYFADSSDRSEWYCDVRMKSGTQLECRVTPVSGGATLVGFRMRPVIGAATVGSEEDTA